MTKTHSYRSYVLLGRAVTLDILIRIPTIIGLGDNAKTKIMQVLEDSWDNNQDHGNVKKWGGAARGIAEYLLIPIEMDPSTA